MTEFVHDLRLAVRVLRRHSGYAWTVVLTLAVTIGVSAVVVAIVDCIVLRPLPFAGSDRTVRIWETNPELGSYRVASLPDLRDWAAASKSFDALALARESSVTVELASGSSTIDAAIATPQWFSIQSIQPQLGRFFREEEMRPGSNRVVILSDEMWRTAFGGDPQIAGLQLRIDGRPYRVVGVLPRNAWMYLFGPAQLWTPLSATQDDVEQRSWRGFVALGRLRPNVTLAAARQELESIQRRLAATYPDTNRGWGADADFLGNVVAGPVQRILFTFLCGVALILAIACANVANLTAAFNSSRQHEFAVRQALGASGGAVARQVVIESILLALTGGLLGLFLAQVGVLVFRSVAPSNIPRVAEVTVDLRIAAITVVLSLMSAVLFGTGPAIAAARTEWSAGARTTRPIRTRRMLVVWELAFAFVLVTATALMARAFSRLLDWNPGFRSDHMAVAWAIAKSGTGNEAVEMFDRTARRLRAIPGVTAVGQTSAGPLFGGVEEDSFQIDARQKGTLRWFDVSPDYFHALGVPLLRGRELSEHDGRGTLPVALINATAARRYWGAADPIGRRIRMNRGNGAADPQFEIVGVVGDVHPFHPNESPAPEIYWPKRQSPRLATYFVIRSDLPAATVAREAATMLQRDEPALQINGFRPLDDLAAEERTSPRFNTMVASTLSGLALVLAAIGTYGLVSFSTLKRTKEIAVRLAIGAGSGRILREILGDGAAMLAAGLVLGALGAAALARALSALLFGLSPFDPLTWIGASVLFTVVVLAACWIPAARAAATDPASSLRVDG